MIDDQDVVARGGKFFFVYKRPGHRVLFNSYGDLIVRPTFVEANVQRVPYRESVRDHLLVSYKRAFIAVCNAQFGRKGFQGGQEVSAAQKLKPGVVPTAIVAITQLVLRHPELQHMAPCNDG